MQQNYYFHSVNAPFIFGMKTVVCKRPQELLFACITANTDDFNIWAGNFYRFDTVGYEEPFLYSLVQGSLSDFPLFYESESSAFTSVTPNGNFAIGYVSPRGYPVVRSVGENREPSRGFYFDLRTMEMIFLTGYTSNNWDVNVDIFPQCITDDGEYILGNGSVRLGSGTLDEQTTLVWNRFDNIPCDILELLAESGVEHAYSEFELVRAISPNGKYAVVNVEIEYEPINEIPYERFDVLIKNFDELFPLVLRRNAPWRRQLPVTDDSTDTKRFSSTYGWLYDGHYPWVYWYSMEGWCWTVPGGDIDGFWSYHWDAQDWIFMGRIYRGWYYSHSAAEWRLVGAEEN